MRPFPATIMRSGSAPRGTLAVNIPCAIALTSPPCLERQPERRRGGGPVIWTGERARQQHRLVAGMYQAAAGVPRERRAAIAGGPPGADKAAELDRAGLDRRRYLTVS